MVPIVATHRIGNGHDDIAYTIVVVPRPPRPGLALAVFALINRGRHWLRRRRRRWSR
jgi:hypothetical protein